MADDTIVEMPIFPKHNGTKPKSDLPGFFPLMSFILSQMDSTSNGKEKDTDFHIKGVNSACECKQ